MSACGKCLCEVTVIVSPKCWPIETIALVCALCGSVVEYMDQMLIFAPKKAAVEHVRRQWVVRHKTALQPSEYEVARELILMGLDGGLSDDEVAEQIGVEAEYVDAIAVAFGGKAR